MGATVGRNGAGLPDVNVDDGKWGGYGPRVDQFAVVPDGGVSSDAVGAGLYPPFDVVPHLVPEESETDPVEGFVLHEVAGGGG